MKKQEDYRVKQYPLFWRLCFHSQTKYKYNYRFTGVIETIKDAKITWRQDVQARLEERHNENDCDKCLGISPTLTTHREFCNSDTVLEKMMLAFEGYCYFASNAWLLENQSKQSKAGNDEEQTPFTNIQEKTLKKLNGLAGRIKIPENAGNFPRHRYDHSVLLADARIPAHIATEINQLNAQTNSRALNLQRNVRTQTSEAIPDFNHADTFVEELEQNEHVPRPFTEQETQVIGVPRNGLIGRLGKTAWQIGVGIAGSSSAIGATTAAGTAIFKSIDAETSKLSATKAAKVHNEASRVCKAADDNWKIMKYEAQRNLRKIRTELLPLIQSLRDHSVPTEFVEALVAQCATQTTALSAQVQTAETEMQICHNEVSEALNAHIARQECYATSQRYAQESFEQMKRKIQNRLANTDLYAYKDLNEMESDTNGFNTVTAKAMKSYYKSALETFTEHIQCSVESNEQGFCQIAKDPLIKSTIDYWFAQFQNLCHQYTRELAKKEYTRNYREVLRDLIIAMTKYVL